jgi:hypothetical protein
MEYRAKFKVRGRDMPEFEFAVSPSGAQVVRDLRYPKSRGMLYYTDYSREAVVKALRTWEATLLSTNDPNLKAEVEMFDRSKLATILREEGIGPKGARTASYYDLRGKVRRELNELVEDAYDMVRSRGIPPEARMPLKKLYGKLQEAQAAFREAEEAVSMADEAALGIHRPQRLRHLASARGTKLEDAGGKFDVALVSYYGSSPDDKPSKWLGKGLNARQVRQLGDKVNRLWQAQDLKGLQRLGFEVERDAFNEDFSYWEESAPMPIALREGAPRVKGDVWEWVNDWEPTNYV